MLQLTLSVLKFCIGGMEAAVHTRSVGTERAEEESRRRRKRSKEKKEKKSRKKHKSHKRPRRDSSSDEEKSEISETSQAKSMISSADMAESKEIEPKTEEEGPVATSVSKQAFFAQLLAKEGSKGSKSVGTVHALGKREQESTQQAANSGDWECYKCGTSNFRQSVQCHKCKAMKRLTEWR